MNKAGIWIGVVVAVVAVYLGATWFTGTTSRKLLDQYAEKLTAESQGQLRVLERKSTPGFFSSVEDITFSVDNPLVSALLGLSAANAQDPVEAGPVKPAQFTIHNVVAHGPLPGLRSFGVARIESSLVLTEEQRKTLIDAVGTDKPLEFFTTVGFLGNTRVDITSPKLAFSNAAIADAQWQGMKLKMNYSKNFTAIKMSGIVPGLMVKATDGSTFAFEKLQMDGDLQKKFDLLFVGDQSFKIGSITVTQAAAPQMPTRLQNLAYVLKFSADDEFYRVNAKVGAETLEITKAQINDVHFDFAVDHLHGPTIAALSKSMEQLSKSVSASSANSIGGNDPVLDPDSTNADPDSTEVDRALPAPIIPEVFTEAMRAQGLTLLQHSPELVVDHVGFAVKEGDFKITARAKLSDVTAEDLAAANPSTQMMNKLVAVVDIGIAQGLIDHWPIGMTPAQAKQTVAQFEQQGFLVRKGDRWVAHLEFTKGALIANGKQLGGNPMN